MLARPAPSAPDYEPDPLRALLEGCPALAARFRADPEDAAAMRDAARELARDHPAAYHGPPAPRTATAQLPGSREKIVAMLRRAGHCPACQACLCYKADEPCRRCLTCPCMVPGEPRHQLFCPGDGQADAGGGEPDHESLDLDRGDNGMVRGLGKERGRRG